MNAVSFALIVAFVVALVGCASTTKEAETLQNPATQAQGEKVNLKFKVKVTEPGNKNTSFQSSVSVNLGERQILHSHIRNWGLTSKDSTSPQTESHKSSFIVSPKKIADGLIEIQLEFLRSENNGPEKVIASTKVVTSMNQQGHSKVVPKDESTDAALEFTVEPSLPKQ